MSFLRVWDQRIGLTPDGPMHDIIIQLLNGLVVGSSFAFVASGLALVFGVLDIVNFAQGELFMLGGYVLFSPSSSPGTFISASLPRE